MSDPKPADSKSSDAHKWGWNWVRTTVAAAITVALATIASITVLIPGMITASINQLAASRASILVLDEQRASLEKQLSTLGKDLETQKKAVASLGDFTQSKEFERTRQLMAWMKENPEAANLAVALDSLGNLENLRAINERIRVTGTTTEILFGQGERALRCQFTNEGRIVAYVGHGGDDYTVGAIWEVDARSLENARHMIQTRKTTQEKVDAANQALQDAIDRSRDKQTEK